MQLNRLNKKPLILAIFAHPDDESFLMGGTLAYYAANGVEVKLLCLTQGEQGYSPLASADERQQLPKIRQRELTRCCEILGVQLLPVLDFPDGRLAQFNVSKLAQPITSAIRSLRPDIILTFGAEGLTGHPDHLAIHRAVKLAFYIAAPAGAALFYGGLSEKSIGQLSNRLEGSVGSLRLALTGAPKIDLDTSIDISQTSYLKWVALFCHQSQYASFKGLSEMDRQVLGQSEYFRLAQVAGAYPVSAIPADQSTPLATDLFSRISHGSKLMRTA